MENIKRQQQIWTIISTVVLVVVLCAIAFALNFLYEKFQNIKKYDQDLLTFKINSEDHDSNRELAISLNSRISELENKIFISDVNEDVFYNLAQNIKIQEISIFENESHYDVEINFIGDEKSAEIYTLSVLENFIKSELIDMNIDLTSQLVGGNLYFKIFK